jgi:hypothetical protein
MLIDDLKVNLAALAIVIALSAAVGLIMEII